MHAIIHRSTRVGSWAAVAALAMALAPRLADAARSALEQSFEAGMTASNVAAAAPAGVPSGDPRPVEQPPRTAPAVGSTARGGKPAPVSGPASGPRPAAPAATVRMPPGPPLRLTLSEAELQSIFDRYEKDRGESARGPLDEVTVRAPAELLPMRDTTHEIWGGIGAPFWALMHPTQAWRIFMPIPPK